MSGLLGLLGRLTTYKITQFSPKDSDGLENWEDERHLAEVHEANAVSSEMLSKLGWDGRPITGVTKWHAVLLDLDVPAWLIPSSTEGHSHLYIDVACTEEDYFNLLDALNRCGVIEHGYAVASKKKGGTYLRLPWVKKELPQPVAVIPVAVRPSDGVDNDLWEF